MKAHSKQCQQNSKNSIKVTKLLVRLHFWEGNAELRQLKIPITARHWTKLTVIRKKVGSYE